LSAGKNSSEHRFLFADIEQPLGVGLGSADCLFIDRFDTADETIQSEVFLDAPPPLLA
jgi:hypothetical protein